MALSQDEIQGIVNQVLSAISTNARSISQLTPVTSLADNDSFEIDGGKRILFAQLRDLLLSLSADEQAAILKPIMDKIGHPDGIAPLGANMKVPSGYLPNPTVLGFDGFVAAPEISIQTEARPISGKVVYDTSRRQFLLCKTEYQLTKPGSVTGQWVNVYYDNWFLSERVGTVSEGRIVPTEGTLYLNREDEMLYHGDEERLVLLGKFTKGTVRTCRNLNHSAMTDSAAGQVCERILHRGIMPLYARPNVFYKRVACYNNRTLFKLPRGANGALWRNGHITIQLPKFLYDEKVHVLLMFRGDARLEQSNVTLIRDSEKQVTIRATEKPAKYNSAYVVLFIDSKRDGDVINVNSNGNLVLSTLRPTDHYPEGYAHIEAHYNRDAFKFWVLKKQRAGKNMGGTRFVPRKRKSTYWGHRVTITTSGIYMLAAASRRYISRYTPVSIKVYRNSEGEVCGYSLKPLKI